MKYIYWLGSRHLNSVDKGKRAQNVMFSALSYYFTSIPLFCKVTFNTFA